jgi:hypothetical protein
MRIMTGEKIGISMTSILSHFGVRWTMRRWEMRKIKFRAWDKGKMIEPMGLLMRDAPQWLDKLSSEAILMQYTGLHDKNGKEIYEGDVVKAWIDFGPGGEGERTFIVSITPFGTNIQEWNYKEQMLPEVIGNIYENPELVEVKG